MNKLKKLLCAAAVSASLGALSAPASANIIGGIDFGVLGEAPSNTHIETATIAATFANAVGNTPQTYGLISVINGDSTYCADGTANCSLYYSTTSTVSAVVGTDLYLTNTQYRIFYSGVAAINLLNQNSVLNLAFITGLTPWASMIGENGVNPTAAGLVADTRIGQSLVGQTIAVLGGGLISIDTSDAFGIAAVEAFLNANSIPTFNGTFADIAFTESGDNFVLNPFDVNSTLADSCRTGAPQVGDWCIQGSADLRGNTVVRVPEPASLGLMGVGLLGLIAGLRRRKAKVVA